MKSKFQKGDVVINTECSTIPPKKSVMIVRSVFTYADTKDDAKRALGDVKVDADTPVYFCSDCHGNTFFIPEYYTLPGSDTAVEALQLASPSDEVAMVMLDDVKSIKYLAYKQSQHQKNEYRRNRNYRYRFGRHDTDDDIDGSESVCVPNPSTPKGGGFFSMFLKRQ